MLNCFGGQAGGFKISSASASGLFSIEAELDCIVNEYFLKFGLSAYAAFREEYIWRSGFPVFRGEILIKRLKQNKSAFEQYEELFPIIAYLILVSQWKGQV